jgi:hypothetical protein
MSDRKKSTIRRANIELNRRNSQAVALRQLRVVLRKVSRAKARGDETITLLVSEVDALARAREIKTSRRRHPVGAPERATEPHRWMARDVFLRRAVGAKVKVANSEVAEEWQVAETMVQKVVRKHGPAAQDWIKKFGGDSESTAVVIAQMAEAFRMLAIERKPLNHKPRNK